MPTPKFQEGNPGRQKGTQNKATRKAKELFLSIMEGEVDNIQDALNAVRKENKGRYLEVLSKFLPYFIPKKIEVDTPTSLTINVRRKS